MPNLPVFLGDTPFHLNNREVKGDFVSIEGEDFYRIANVDQMRPFLMSIVSSSDHWMFISSNGALSAGRKNPQHALFPYYTDDKIHDAPELTGAKSLFFIHQDGKRFLWEPFSNKYKGIYQTETNLYKHVMGNKILFEEINHDLGVCFQYSWGTSEKYGFVKKSTLKNIGNNSLKIEILDGIQNLLPSGVNLDMQTELSTLVDAYKKNELEADTGLGIFSLSSILVDKPEPSEALKSTTVWSIGLENASRLLSSVQLEAFRKGEDINQEIDIRAERGAYFLHGELDLSAGGEQNWITVAEIDQRISKIVALSKELENSEALKNRLLSDMNEGAEKLAGIVASADGLQLTDDRLSTTRHFSNVMFNVMRGGIFDDNYQVQKVDFLDYLQKTNETVFNAHHDSLNKITDSITALELVDFGKTSNDSALLRLCYEYLPLTFSRRHGDPSRPWNFFSIETRNDDGSKILNYEGNWRDIFQNWEALSISYPEFTESIICKFVNASTADGYNPYRITRDGIDWEVHDPSDPWSFIGYWGDHQIIYLLKLLEVSFKHHPGRLGELLEQDIFVYANVPYRIKSYPNLLANPKDTIVFDEDLAEAIDLRVKTIGSDGKLIFDNDNSIYKVNLTEKILVTALAKISNFIPEGGIWMNTQRPEWNDANNALVGYGVSMVTLYYLRRFQLFCKALFQEAGENNISVSEEVATLLRAIIEVFSEYEFLLKGKISDQDRKKILDGVGEAADEYRSTIYKNGFSTKKASISKTNLEQFFDLSLAFIDHTIEANKRADNLYHAYNLMEVTQNNGVAVSTMYEMLEGQVGILSSGFLSANESIELLKSMKKSGLYREDQYSYMLYPDRQLARFTEKNQLPSELNNSALVTKLLSEGNSELIEKDIDGGLHFYGDFRNVGSVEEVLEKLAKGEYADLVAQDRQLILDTFEKVFNHRAFTGRSGTFYGYEGLGSIYWHMVSKLLLAVGETFYQAVELQENPEILGKLIEFYYEIRAGIGLNKNPKLYGAFPIDPYSHTPGNAGAQQPGMTGQVKEDILARHMELGVLVNNGSIVFKPSLLRKAEFLKKATTFDYHTLEGEKAELEIPAGGLVFTYCQVPFTYYLSEEAKIVLTLEDNSTEEIQGLILPAERSASIFERRGEVKRMEVFLFPEI